MAPRVSGQMMKLFLDIENSLRSFISISSNPRIIRVHKMMRINIEANFNSLKCSLYLRMDCWGETKLPNVANLCSRCFLAMLKILAYMVKVMRRKRKVFPTSIILSLTGKWTVNTHDVTMNVHKNPTRQKPLLQNCPFIEVRMDYGNISLNVHG